jgi:hypothetical protein
LPAQELLESYSEAVMRQAIALALKGDAGMLKALLVLIHPRRKDLPSKIGPLPMGNATELSQASEKLMKRVTAGKISVSDASGIFGLMERRRQMIETEDHEKRLQAVEQRADEERAE